ncbi:MAG: NAD-dependent deacetylase [Dehalococcoidia bacterium]
MESSGKFPRGLDQAAEFLVAAKYVVALTGAGISVESGIRPFRGPGGLWTEYGEPPMDGYQRFLADPKADWERRLKREGYAQALYEALERAQPNPAHRALAHLEELGIVKCVITQNVDNLHRAAGSQNVAEIHGNFFLVRCLQCSSRFPRNDISLAVLPPPCPRCQGILKTDGVMFGEPIPADVLRKCEEETSRCDCMLVAGTSAFVYPAAGFPQMVRRSGGSLIEVNLDETELTPSCQVSLQGKAGEVLPELVKAVRARMGK